MYDRVGTRTICFGVYSDRSGWLSKIPTYTSHHLLCLLDPQLVSFSKFPRSSHSSLPPKLPLSQGLSKNFKMQFEPPTKPNDVNVSIGDAGNSSAEGVDQNGIVTGRWKTGIFGFTDSMVPNGVMSCCCTGVVVAQIASRIGLMKFTHAIGAFGLLYFIAFLALVTDSDFFEVITWLAAIVALLCCVRLRWRLRTLFSIPGSPLEDLAYSLCCGCCSVAQMASHVESYEPGVFAFAPRATLEGYSST